MKTEEEIKKHLLSSIVISLCYKTPESDKALRKILRKFPKDGKELFSKAEILNHYRKMISEGSLERNGEAEDFLVTKPTRSASGVTAVTIMTKPFPCPGRCVFCPDEENMPKSYLSNEPGSMRALENSFDPYRQVTSRLSALRNTGHSTEKPEIIVLGGSFSHYDDAYRIEFTKGIYAALNDFETDVGSGRKTDKYEKVNRFSSLLTEQKKNENAKTRCVGLSFETRADMIDENEIIFLRRLGCTKIQLGVQSLDEEVLNMNGVGMKTEDIRRAFNLLRSAGFKIQAHVMVNLPGSDPAKDMETYKKLFRDPLCPDEVKIYPLAVVKKSPLYKKFESGEFSYYPIDTLIDLLSCMLKETPRYCRVTRMIRDIPLNSTAGDAPSNNLRETVEKAVKKSEGNDINIRNREIKGDSLTGDLAYVQTIYNCGPYQERFIECIDEREKLAGFLRLSIPLQYLRSKSEKSVRFPKELSGSALVRELHVYGKPVAIGEKNPKRSQHRGIGTKLLQIATEASYSTGCRVLSVISSVGTRNYYRKLGFMDGEMYQHRFL